MAKTPRSDTLSRHVSRALPVPVRSPLRERTAPEDLAAWDPPADPELVTRFGEAFIRAIRSNDIRADEPTDVAWAIDEWLLSSDYKDIPEPIRVMLGVVLLKIFTRNPDQPRGSPGVDVATRAILTISTRSLRAVRARDARHDGRVHRRIRRG